MNSASATRGGPAAGIAPAAPAERADWLGAGRLAGLIALFLFVLYPGVILGTHSFFYRDFGVFTYPVAWHTHESFWRGEVPLWNPLNNSGVPFLAQWNTTVCYPLSLIYMLFPLPGSVNYFGLIHLVIAGAGMYLLAYRWTQNRLAASIAGLAFALNGLMLNCLIWTSNLAALSWQPWVVLCVEQAWRRGGRRMVIAAFASAMQMLAGAPEVILFTWLALAVLWMIESGRKTIPCWPALRRFVIMAGLVAGLAAIQLLPFLDLLAHSERDSSNVLADAWPMPWWGWANYVVPLFHCAPSALGYYRQTGQYWTPSYYLGIGVLALALTGAWRARTPKTWWLTGMALVGLVLALGNDGQIYAWLKHAAPWIGFMRFPIKFVALPTFAIPLLAAYGFASVQSTPPGQSRRGEKTMFFAGALLLVLAALVLAATRWCLKPEDYWSSTWPNGVSRALFLIAILGGISALIRFPATRSGGLIGFAVLMLIGLDATTAERRQNPTVVAKAFGPLELNMSFRPRYGESRALLTRQTLLFLGKVDTSDPLHYCIGVRGALYENCNLLENIPKVDGFCSLHLEKELDMLTTLYDRTNAFPAPLADFLGVAQVSAPDTIFAWQPRPNCLPLVTAGQRPVFADKSETLEELSGEKFNPRQLVYLPKSVRGEVTATNLSDAQIASPQFAAHRIQFTAAASTPAMVVIAQSFYHNWRAFVDGHPVPLWPANHAYQALEIPAGRHEVLLVYRDLAFRIGAVISTLTLLGGLAWLLLATRSSRSEKRCEGPDLRVSPVPS